MKAGMVPVSLCWSGGRAWWRQQWLWVGNRRGCCDEGKDVVKGAGSGGWSCRPRSHA